jgi:hypothetical protein
MPASVACSTLLPPQPHDKTNVAHPTQPRPQFRTRMVAIVTRDAAEEMAPRISRGSAGVQEAEIARPNGISRARVMQNHDEAAVGRYVAGMRERLSAHDLTQFTDGVWLTTEPVRIVGMKLAATMTVLRVPGSRLLLHSPVAMTKERRDAVESLGTVAHLYAPNTFHHIWMSEWANAFPGACVHAPSALRKKRPDLRIDRAHDADSMGDLDQIFDEVHIGGFALEESVLVHRPSQTLVVADFVHNIGRPADRWTALYAKAMGFYDRVALSRVIRWTAFSNPAATRESLERLASYSFERLIVGHGRPLERNAREAVFEAYEWAGKPARPSSSSMDGNGHRFGRSTSHIR